MSSQQLPLQVCRWKTEVASAVAGTAGCTLREAASNALRKHLALWAVLRLD